MYLYFDLFKTIAILRKRNFTSQIFIYLESYFFFIKNDSILIINIESFDIIWQI